MTHLTASELATEIRRLDVLGLDWTYELEQLTSLASQSEEQGRDAARYRFLRDSVGYARGAHPMDDHPPHCVFGKFDTDRHVNRPINGTPLDAAIDAAMATPKEGA